MYFPNYLNAFTFIYTFLMKLLSSLLSFYSFSVLSLIQVQFKPAEGFNPMIPPSAASSSLLVVITHVSVPFVLCLIVCLASLDLCCFIHFFRSWWKPLILDSLIILYFLIKSLLKFFSYHILIYKIKRLMWFMMEIKRKKKTVYLLIEYG